MNVPIWLKLAAASDNEIVEELLNAIEEMGGIDKAQEALRQSNKQANWVTHEKFVVSKTVVDMGREMHELTLKKRKEMIEDAISPNKIPPAPPTAETTPPLINPKPEDKMSQAMYIATLLGMLLAGAAGTLGVQQLSNIDLRQTLSKIVAQDQQLNEGVTDRIKDMLSGKRTLPKVDVSKELERGMAYQQEEFKTPSEIAESTEARHQQELEEETPVEGDTTEIPKEIKPEPTENTKNRAPFKGVREKKKKQDELKKKELERQNNPEEPMQ